MMKFKQLTPENWLTIDDDCSLFWWVSKDGTQAGTMNGEDWLEVFLAPKLLPSVPANVRDLFEIARGALVYGYFFYPLFTLALEQLFRVGETAISERRKQAGASIHEGGRKYRFKENVDWLRRNNQISEDQFEEWEALRDARNYASHPERPSKIPPGAVGLLLKLMAKRINLLFASPDEIELIETSN
jgi:hypothetical protein